QKINFTPDFGTINPQPTVDPVGTRVSTDPGKVEFVPPAPPVVKASLGGSVATPGFADTTTFDLFSTITGTVTVNNADGTLRFGIVGGQNPGSGPPRGPGEGPPPDGGPFDVSLVGNFGTLFLNSSTGAYVYVPDDIAINALTQNTTETFNITISDGTNT